MEFKDSSGVRRLVLASRSPRRKQLLEEAGISIECDSADIDELEAHEVSPRHLALVNAHSKALAVAARREGDVVLGADTIVVLDGAVYGKPRDLDDAAKMLSRLAGRVHEVITGVCIVHWECKEIVQFHEATQVKFRDLGPEEIRAYLGGFDPLDKAGAYAAQDDEGRIIERIEGSFSNVVGLPMERTLAALERHFGF